MKEHPASAMVEARTERPSNARYKPATILLSALPRHDSSKKFYALVTLHTPRVLDYRDPVSTCWGKSQS